MTADYFAEVSHQRYNPLTDSWILVSPHRAKRPWLGQVEKIVLAQLPAYDPQCYLCPGNKRISNDANPDYKGAYVFTNDFSAFMQDIKEETVDERLFKIKIEKGISRVIIYSPLGLMK